MAPAPSPQERADYIVRKLEQLIRDGKSDAKNPKGMSFKTWQGLARAEIANAFADIEGRKLDKRHDLTAKRLLVVGASALVTIGFWIAVTLIDRTYGRIPSFIIMTAGGVMLLVLAELGFRHLVARYKTERRKHLFTRIEDFDTQLKRLENETWLKLKRARDRRDEEE